MFYSSNFNTSVNFWDTHPEYKIPFKDLYKKGSLKTSSIMWAITLLQHPYSPFFNLNYEDRIKEIIQDLNLPSDFSFDDYQSVIDLFEKITFTHPQKAIVQWRKELEDRSKYLSSIEYSQDTPIELIEFKEKLLKNTTSLWDQYRKAEKELKEEKEISTVGGSQPSLQDQNLI